MSDINLEALRRQASQLERNERKRGELGFELSFESVRPLMVAFIGLVLVTIALVHALVSGNWGYVIGIGLGIVIWAAYEKLDGTVDFIRDDYEGFKEQLINGGAVLTAVLALMYGLSKGNDPVGAAIISFIIYMFCKGAGYVAFAILELVVEYWWVIAALLALALMVIFG